MSEQLFSQRSTKVFPDRDGWYNTDKGLLYWFVEEQEWSCRDDRVSEEYPKFWYKPAPAEPVEAHRPQPVKPSLHAIDCSCEACKRFEAEMSAYFNTHCAL